MTELDDFYNVCLKLTKEVGVINKAINQPKEITVKTSECDLVTATDQQVEEILILGLQKAFPDHKVIAEETASREGDFELTDEPTWIIDPIDGTLNFVHTFPPVIGVIYNPVLEQLYTARAGKGAFLNGNPIKCSGQKEFSKALICMGLHRDPVRRPNNDPIFFANLERIVGRVQGCRVTGSAALSMAFVAAGGADAHFERGLKPWDMAAGELLILEAGGCLMNFKGEPFDVMKPHLICAATRELALSFAQTLSYDPVKAPASKNTFDTDTLFK